jgi:hypothetical protein
VLHALSILILPIITFGEAYSFRDPSSLMNLLVIRTLQGQIKISSGRPFQDMVKLLKYMTLFAREVTDVRAVS